MYVMNLHMYLCICVFFLSLFRILFTCHGVFYKQLSSWLLHGLLQDSHSEFFIEPAVPTSSAAKKEEELDEKDSADGEPKGMSLFVINPILAPSYMPVRVLEKVSSTSLHELTVHCYNVHTLYVAENLCTCKWILFS